jgi:hypothetical protein
MDHQQSTYSSSEHWGGLSIRFPEATSVKVSKGEISGYGSSPETFIEEYQRSSLPNA